MSEERKFVTPAPAATILVVRDDPFEVLMVKRRSSKSMYSSALVFPGGLVEAADASLDWLPHIAGAGGMDANARALRIAGFRETHEETGILLGSGVAPGAADQPFIDVVRTEGVTLDLNALAPFGHWITPEAAPKRFDTHFFLALAPDGAEPVSDNNETVSVEWVKPIEALARSEAGDYSILFPTLMNLKRLAESADAASALAAARARPAFTVRPTMSKRDGQTILNIPAEAGYGLTEYANSPQSTLLGPKPAGSK